MNRNRLLTIVALLLLAGSVFAKGESPLRDAGPMPLPLAGGEEPDATAVYIVQLRGPSAAEHHADLLKTASVAAVPGKGRVRLDSESAAVKSYAAQLVAEQDRVLARLGPDVHKIYSYRYRLNGFAARMSVAQAEKLENLPEVLNVWEDEIRPLALRHSPTFLGLFDGESGLRSTQGLNGEDIIIGFIDSGGPPEAVPHQLG